VSSKPSTLPIWATDPAALVTEPNLGKKELGHADDEPLFGDYENWYKNLVYRWTEYLRDGVLSGDHSIAGKLNIAGGLGHGEQMEILHPGLALLEAGAAPSIHTSRELTWPSLTNARTFSFPLPLKVGDRLTTWSLTCPTAAGTWTAVVERVPRATPGSPVPLATVPTIPGGTSLFGAINHTVQEDSTYNLRISTGASAAALTFTQAVLRFDRTV